MPPCAAARRRQQRIEQREVEAPVGAQVQRAGTGARPRADASAQPEAGAFPRLAPGLDVDPGAP